MFDYKEAFLQEKLRRVHGQVRFDTKFKSYIMNVNPKLYYEALFFARSYTEFRKPSEKTLMIIKEWKERGLL